MIEKISGKDYKAMLPELREGLLNAQFKLRDANSPLIIIISGFDAAGRSEVVDALTEWLDPRGVDTISLLHPTDEEQNRPYFWRFWRRSPQRGNIGIYFGAWYVDPMLNFNKGDIGEKAFRAEMTKINAFETMLIEDGALILKYWLHLSEEKQSKRLHKFDKDKHSKRLVTESDWKHLKQYKKLQKTNDAMLELTSTESSPWRVIEAEDDYARNYNVGRSLLDAMSNYSSLLSAEKEFYVQPEADTEQKVGGGSYLKSVDLSLSLGKGYKKELDSFQSKLHLLAWNAFDKGISTVLVYEGWDAAGKGGNIRRITSAVDSRLYRVVTTAAPSKEELSYHYLWRFWKHIPCSGNMTIYDRSWYGRVLVERVENLATPAEWGRAYDELNNFEADLIAANTVVVKYWLHISPEEQLRRFEHRKSVSYKKHKITDEDWRNRERWDDYEVAVNEMIEKTSTKHAPWTLISANDKKYARIQAIKTLCDRLEEKLG